MRSVNITFQDEAELLEAVGNTGPVSVAFQVNGSRIEHDRESKKFALSDRFTCILLHISLFLSTKRSTAVVAGRPTKVGEFRRGWKQCKV